MKSLFKKLDCNKNGSIFLVSVFSDGIRFVNSNEAKFIPFKSIVDDAYENDKSVIIKTSDSINYIDSDLFIKPIINDQTIKYINLNRLISNKIESNDIYLFTIINMVDGYIFGSQNYDIYNNKIDFYTGNDYTETLLFKDIKSFDTGQMYNMRGVKINTNREQFIVASKAESEVIKYLIEEFQSNNQKSDR